MLAKLFNIASDTTGKKQLFRRDLPGQLSLLADCGIVGVLVIAPLFMGGRDERGAFVYAMAVMLAAVAWCASQAVAIAHERTPWRKSAMQYILLGGLMLLCLQLIPLGGMQLARLSPTLAEWLPVWSATRDSAAKLGQWQTLSLAPHATQQALAVYLAHAIFFLLLMQRLRSLRDVQRLLQLLAIACVGYALLGLLQFLGSNGKFLWLYEHPYRTTLKAVKGPFANENHFAHLLALGLGPCIWWLQHLLNGSESKPEGARSARRSPARKNRSIGSNASRGVAMSHAVVFMVFALALVALAGLLTFSRGGVLVLLAAAVTATMLCFWKKLLSLQYAVAVAGAALFVAIGLTIFGGDKLSNQMESIRSGDLEQIDSSSTRRDLWAGDLAISSLFPLTGTGAGSHIEVYPVRFERFSTVKYSHAESGYIHVLLECGIAGLLLALAGIALIGYWSFISFHANNRAIQACAIAILTALAASLLHSSWDFVWYLPACLSWSIALAAAAYRLSQCAKAEFSGSKAHSTGKRAEKSSTPIIAASGTERPAWYWSLAALALLGASAMMYQALAPPAMSQIAWDRYLRFEEKQKREGELPHAEVLNQSIALLDAVIACDPRHGEARLALASCCLQRFDELQRDTENRMDLAQIREAAVASRFSSREALYAWLHRAIGDNLVLLEQAKLHALRTVESSPMQGEAYVYLADLAFLDGASPAASDALLQQALLVRPYDGEVCFAAGAHAALAGRMEESFAHWKIAFHGNPRYQQLIVDRLAPRMPADDFLREFSPDLSGNKLVYARYRELNREEDAKTIGRIYVVQLETEARASTGTRAASFWRAVGEVHQYLDQPELALPAMENAVLASPDDFMLRKRFALELLRQNQYERAGEELQWCLARKPADATLKELAIRAKRDKWEAMVPQVGSRPAEATQR